EAPALALCPMAGPAGQPVTITGSGFAQGATYLLYYDGAYTGQIGSIDNTGAILPFSFVVPAFSSIGDHAVAVIDTYSNQAVLTYVLNGVAPEDTDHDGVPDSCDCAPGDPANAIAQEVGALDLSQDQGVTRISWDADPSSGPFRLYRGYRKPSVLP